MELFEKYTLPKTNMDTQNTQNDGLEKVTPLKKGNFLVSMLDFWGVTLHEMVNFHGIHISIRRTQT